MIIAASHLMEEKWYKLLLYLFMIKTMNCHGMVSVEHFGVHDSCENFSAWVEGA